MEFMGAICCAFPTLVASAVLYGLVPKLRRAILVLGCLGGGLFALAAGRMVYDEARNGPVVAAVDDRDPASLRRALEAGGSARADVGMDGYRPVLLKAIENGDTPSVEILLARGADPNRGDEDLTPLKAARGKPKIVRLLQRYGAR